MLKEARRVDREFAFNYAKIHGYEFFHGNEEAGECTMHYVSLDNDYYASGYMAVHIEGNSIKMLEFISYTKNKGLFLDFETFLKKISLVAEDATLEICRSSPAYRIFKRYSRKFNLLLLSSEEYEGEIWETYYWKQNRR